VEGLLAASTKQYGLFVVAVVLPVEEEDGDVLLDLRWRQPAW
jgi:hypothetical protein